jgi:hypothetical protein
VSHTCELLRPSAGGTLIKVLEDIIGRGASPSMIRVVTVVCAPAALQKLSTGFPGGLEKLSALCSRCLVCCSLMRSHAEEQPDNFSSSEVQLIVELSAKFSC